MGLDRSLGQFFELVGVVVEPCELPVVRLDQQLHEPSSPALLFELLLLMHASVELPGAFPAFSPGAGELPQLSGVVVASLQALVGADDHVPPSPSLGTRIQPYYDTPPLPLEAEPCLASCASSY
jgi:hypothetical protein